MMSSGVPLVELVSFDLASAERVAAGDRSLLASAANAAAVAPILLETATMQVALYRRTGASAPWIGYLGRDPIGNAIVGACSFTDRCRNGEVEIAYFTFPGSEGQGWGGRMALALIEIAWRDAELETIFAHTLPEENASTRILRRAGFVLFGAVDHPEDGMVWRWELNRP